MHAPHVCFSAVPNSLASSGIMNFCSLHLSPLWYGLPAFPSLLITDPCTVRLVSPGSNRPSWMWCVCHYGNGDAAHSCVQGWMCAVCVCAVCVCVCAVCVCVLCVCVCCVCVHCVCVLCVLYVCAMFKCVCVHV